jgi:pimeloyl-ACP methyl ester carboxylesterase
VQRAIELLRPTTESTIAPAPSRARPAGTFDAPVGRYVHVELDGRDHRIYFEEAGRGIPLLLQHTAGAHGSQWRHLFECSTITDHFRLIAYDLPFHGKSVPPDGTPWWTEQYRLTGAFLRQVPLALASALELDRPAFMGCSVGGLLALDLALHHPDRFRAAISVEGALHIGGDPDTLVGFWHPQVSNETKARMMEGLTSPTAPIARRKETIQVYSAGWPQAFLGDLYYYMVDYDLRDRAHEIDTSRVAVHIMSGEYDYSGAIELGRAAHEAIGGSTFTEMPGIGHFPMSEDPDTFVTHLLPVLDAIRAAG